MNYLTLEYVCGRSKKLDDGNYYTFRVFSKTKGGKKDRKLNLIFKAKQIGGSHILEFTYELPKYTNNQDNLVKVSTFMIEYCLSLNQKYELYMDNDLYKMHKEELHNMQNIEFKESDIKSNELLVPSLSKQNKASRKIQDLFVKLLYKRKNKARIKRELVFKGVVKKNRALY
jgi:hypothetical protein